MIKRGNKETDMKRHDKRGQEKGETGRRICKDGRREGQKEDEDRKRRGKKERRRKFGVTREAVRRESDRGLMRDVKEKMKQEWKKDT